LLGEQAWGEENGAVRGSARHLSADIEGSNVCSWTIHCLCLPALSDSQHVKECILSGRREEGWRSRPHQRAGKRNSELPSPSLCEKEKRKAAQPSRDCWESKQRGEQNWAV